VLVLICDLDGKVVPGVNVTGRWYRLHQLRHVKGARRRRYHQRRWSFISGQPTRASSPPLPSKENKDEKSLTRAIIPGGGRRGSDEPPWFDAFGSLDTKTGATRLALPTPPSPTLSHDEKAGKGQVDEIDIDDPRRSAGEWILHIEAYDREDRLAIAHARIHVRDPVAPPKHTNVVARQRAVLANQPHKQPRLVSFPSPVSHFFSSVSLPLLFVLM
jgi:hypothetical protein